MTRPAQASCDPAARLRLRVRVRVREMLMQSYSSNASDHVVRVFVSSTFRDMHAERDHLNRFVFPELRARCMQRGWDFLGVDLRWGIPEEETTRGDLLSLCLSEVDRCRPLFLGLLGDRYGTVLPPTTISRTSFERVWSACTASERAWLEGYYLHDETAPDEVYRLAHKATAHAPQDRIALAEFWQHHDEDGSLYATRSITAAEFEYAAFNPATRVDHPFFYLRRPPAPSPAGTPALHPPAGTASEKARQEALRRQVRELENATLRHYDAADPAGMEAFGGQVLEDLWSAAEALIAKGDAAVEEAGPVSALASATRRDAFVRQRTRVFIGREQTMRALFDYVAQDCRSPLLVTGEAGTGKSALLANFVQQCRSHLPDSLIAAHFIGASPESTRLDEVRCSLAQQLGLPDPDLQILRSGAAIAKRAFQALLHALASERQVILVVDGLDQVESPAGPGAGDWLPHVLPRGVRLVASGVRAGLSRNLLDRLGPGRVLELEGLAPDDSLALARAHLAHRQKRLPALLLERLIDERMRIDARLPLYLMFAIDELCVFGQHEALAARVDALPPSLPALLDQVLQRLEDDHGRELVCSVASWLAVARAGLTEPELLDLLARHHGHVRPIQWSWLRNALRGVLNVSAGVSDEAAEGGALGIFVEAFRSAVFERYFGMHSSAADPSPAWRQAHRELAEHATAVACPLVGHWQAERVRALASITYHYVRASAGPEVTRVLLDPGFLEAKATAGLLLQTVGELAEAAAVVDDAVRDTLGAIERALRSEIQFLARHPQTLFQVLWNHTVPNGDDTHADRGLQALLTRWKAQVESRDPPLAWIRSLLPLTTGADALNHMTLRGHQHVVFAVACSPDGSLVASGSRDGSVRVWDAATGAVTAMLEGHANQVLAVEFIDNHRLLSASGNPRMQMSDGSTFGVTDYTVRLWSVPDEAELARSVEHGGMVRSVVASPDGLRVHSGDAEGMLRTWSIDDWSTVTSVQAHEDSIADLVGAPGGVISCSDRGVICLWDGVPLACRKTLAAGDDFPSAIALSPDGEVLAVASRDGVTVRHVARNEALFRVDAGAVFGIAWSPDGLVLVGGAGDGTVRLWDTRTCAEIGRYGGHEGPVTSVAVSRRDGRIVSGSMDGSVRIWRPAGGLAPPNAPWHTGQVLCVRPSRSGRCFVTASADTTAIVWDARTGAVRSRLQGHGRSATCAALLDGDALAVTGSLDDTVRLWDVSTGRQIAAFDGRCLGPESLAVSPEGGHVAFCGIDGSVCVLDVRSRSVTARLQVPSPPAVHPPGVPWFAFALAYSADGRTLAAGGLAEVVVWDASTGALKASFEASPGLASLAMAPEGDKLAAGGLGRIEVWDLIEVQRAQQLEGHGHLVGSLAFSADGQFLVSASEDATARVWSVASGRCIGVLQGAADITNLVAGARTIDATHETNETSFMSASDGRMVGWFPGIVGTLRALDDGAAWAGATRTGQVYLLRLEGVPEARVPLPQLVPALTRTWRATMFHLLRNGDRAAAAEVLVQRQAVCEEMADEQGLRECAADRLLIGRDERDDWQNGESGRRLAERFEPIRQGIRDGVPGAELLALIWPFSQLARELGEFDALRVALSLQMKIQMESQDDAALLETLQELAFIDRHLGALESLINILGVQTEVLEKTGDLEGALHLTREMVERAREIGDHGALNQALRRRCALQHARGDAHGAVETLEQIVREADSCDDLQTADVALEDLAFTHLDAGHHDAAVRAFERQEAICRRRGDPRRMVACLINSAVAERPDKRLRLAKIAQAQALAERHGLQDLKDKASQAAAYIESC